MAAIRGHLVPGRLLRETDAAALARAGEAARAFTAVTIAPPDPCLAEAQLMDLADGVVGNHSLHEWSDAFNAGRASAGGFRTLPGSRSGDNKRKKKLRKLRKQAQRRNRR